MAYSRALLCFCLLFLVFHTIVISARDYPKSVEHTGENDTTVVEVGPICRRCPPRKTPPPLQKGAYEENLGRGGYNKPAH